MPPSPATSRLRSESYDCFSITKACRMLDSDFSKPETKLSATLLTTRTTLKPRKIIPPTSIEYWLPSYDDAVEENGTGLDFSSH